MPRLCKWCKNTFRGRTDKIFCSTQCKSQYHIELRKETAKASKNIDRILHRNRSILYEVMGPKNIKMKVNRQVLDKKKFNYRYITGYHINKENKMYHSVYDYAWMEFSDGHVLIVKKKK